MKKLTLKAQIDLANKIGDSAIRKPYGDLEYVKARDLKKDIKLNLSFIYDESCFIGNPDLLIREYVKQNPSKSFYVWLVDLGLRIG